QRYRDRQRADEEGEAVSGGVGAAGVDGATADRDRTAVLDPGYIVVADGVRAPQREAGHRGQGQSVDVLVVHREGIGCVVARQVADRDIARTRQRLVDLDDLDLHAVRVRGRAVRERDVAVGHVLDDLEGRRVAVTDGARVDGDGVGEVADCRVGLD